VDLQTKIRTLPTDPGVYLYKDAAGEVLYVGKAKNLRARVRTYFLEGAAENAKTGSLLREAVDVEYIVVANEKEALALENNLIKQKKPRFNILLRDDKTYPYIKLTLADQWPRLSVTRRLKKDGSAYYGPYFPANLAYRLMDLVHRTFRLCNCSRDLSRRHPRPCFQFYLGRCLGPAVEGGCTPEAYRQAAEDARLFLEGKHGDLGKSLEQRMARAAEAQQYELAATYRDMIATIAELEERQRMAAAEGDDADAFGYHYEDGRLAVNLFHLRGGKMLDRREFFWEELDAAGFDAGEVFSTLLKQLYLDQQYVPAHLYVPTDFEDRAMLEEMLSERGRKVEIAVPQRGAKRSLVDLASNNARHSYDQRFRVMKPSVRAIQQALQDALTLPELPRRVECFDISHIQGAETVASLVVWEEGRMKKSDYRKFLVREVAGVDDFAAMREVVGRRYRRLQQEKQKLPSLVLVDGGLGQLHAAAEALEELSLTSQPLAALAKREEILYVYGQESEPIALDHHSPVLHLVQQIRDEAHRFAVGFHRKRRQMRDRASELLDVPGIGEATRRRLLEHFGSVRAVKQADAAALAAVVTRAQAEAILEHFRK
jgi:excinuclease ABC subunit C